MASITAAAVKALRERTGLPMMDCKRALQETGGDEDGAIELLRKAGEKIMGKRADRQTATGQVAVYIDPQTGHGAMIELLCESAPVAGNEEFVALADNLAKQLVTGPGAATADELLDQPSPDGSSKTLREQFDDLVNRIREVFRLNRIVRIDGSCGGYAHHNGRLSVLLEVEGDNADLAKDICMHIAAMRPSVVGKDDLDEQLVAKEREILAEVARQEGKPEDIIDKMVEGRLRNFYAERCLNEQPFVKDDKQTVGKLASAAGVKVVQFVHWEISEE